MQIRSYSDFATFAQECGPLWRQIVPFAPAATVFQTWEWNAAWWQHFGRGKRFLGLAITEGEETVGLAAFFLPRFSPLRTLRVVGDSGSDYLDIIAAPGKEDAVGVAVAQFLHEKRGWDWGDLQQAKPGAVVEQIAQSFRGAEVWQGETCPYLPLPGNWETFRKTLGKKLRSNIGYYERSAAKQYALEFRVADSQSLTGDMTAFYELHQKRWRGRFMPGAFASERARAFHHQVARTLLDAGMLRLHTLSLDGKIRAALYCFHCNGRTIYYLGGFDPAPELAKFSLGTVLTARAIRHAIEEDQAREFDFLRGNEGYKYKWNAQDRFNQRISLVRPGVRSALLNKVGRLSLALEARLKTYMHQKHGGASHGKPSSGSDK